MKSCKATASEFELSAKNGFEQPLTGMEAARKGSFPPSALKSMMRPHPRRFSLLSGH